MSDFQYTPLMPGEEIVFGVSTSTSSSSSQTIVNGVVAASNNEQTERRAGITNKRVIVEHANAPERTVVVSNAEVRRIKLKRVDFMGEQTLTLEAIEFATGEAIDLDITFIDAQDEPRLRELFSGAAIVYETPTVDASTSQANLPTGKRKGLLGFLGF
ncbi:MAG: hypothetical protein H0V88_11270 [Pyrinomonadaceae bacterium]|nr:hypothetical protein [Pyrinomonadaceae bacterium]